MKRVIAELIHKALKQELKERKEKIEISLDEIESFIETPPNSELGDYAFPCFFLSRVLKEPPNEIAVFLRKNIGNEPLSFEEIQTSGPYLNFFIDRVAFAQKVISQIKKEKNNYGKTAPEKKINTMVEFPSPNTNKPLHLGHLRNMAIGESISRLLSFNGEKVIRANLNNDRGIHICQSMAAYQKYGKNLTPSKAGKKPDHFVGDYYVMFNEKSKKNEELEIFSHRLLQKWEQGDKEVLALWEKMNKWAFEGFQETYKKFQISHDVEFFESKIYKKGKEIVLDGLKKGIFIERPDKAVIADLKNEGLGEKVLLRIDGTSVYITQDLYLAKLKFEKYNLDKSIYVVANEQNYHFEVLFTLLKKLGFEKEMIHLSYGMVELPEGRMKSREGTVVDADDIIEKVQNLVKKELSSRANLSEKELEKRSLKIALAAIKYILLKSDIKKNMVFNPKDSINFEGDTGPYLLYSYARATSILKKIKTQLKPFTPEKLEKSEVDLSKKLSDFKEVVLKAYTNLNPSLITNYSFQLAKIFNEFYHNCPVIIQRRHTLEKSCRGFQASFGNFS
jgi:arginyl-tRNA synthetase